MSAARFSTITGSDWRDALRAARARRNGDSLPAGAPGGFRCPVCSKLGVMVPQAGGGFMVRHRAGIECVPVFTGGRRSTASSAMGKACP